MTESNILLMERRTQLPYENLLVAIGVRAIKDYIYAVKRYNKIAAKADGENRAILLFRCNYARKEAERFFTKDPYAIFPNGGGKQIIEILNKRHHFTPVPIPTKEEYEEIMKRLDK